jgi:hypothetical protein
LAFSFGRALPELGSLAKYLHARVVVVARLVVVAMASLLHPGNLAVFRFPINERPQAASRGNLELAPSFEVFPRIDPIARSLRGKASLNTLVANEGIWW